jgi:carbonic anhydrase
MDKLLRGVRHFRDNVFSTRRKEYQRVAKGQNPLALFITCSDSRVDPELLTSSGPGDIFVLRNAGNIVPPYGISRGGESATVEYAITGLGIRNVVVCGHIGCGAMRALMEPELVKGLPMTASWVAHAETTRAVAQSRFGRLNTPEERWRALVEVNVITQLDHLCTHPCIAAGLADGSVDLYGWVFDFHNGEVTGYDAQHGEFVPLTDPSETAPRYRPRWKLAATS